MKIGDLYPEQSECGEAAVVNDEGCTGSMRPGDVRRLPIRRIDFLNLAEESAHDAIVIPVARMLALQMQRQAIRPQEEAHDLDCQIQQVDQEIDCRVYKLYGLTDEEINIVQGR